jgi:hypothetical protein
MWRDGSGALPGGPPQFGNIVPGVYTSVLAKHSKHFSLEDSLAIRVDRMQRNSGPLKQQVEDWCAMQLSATITKTARTLDWARKRRGAELAA